MSMLIESKPERVAFSDQSEGAQIIHMPINL